MSENHSDLLYRSKSRYFASKNHTRGLGTIDSSISDANHAVVHAKNIEDGWDP